MLANMKHKYSEENDMSANNAGGRVKKLNMSSQDFQQEDGQRPMSPVTPVQDMAKPVFHNRSPRAPQKEYGAPHLNYDDNKMTPSAPCAASADGFNCSFCPKVRQDNQL